MSCALNSANLLLLIFDIKAAHSLAMRKHERPKVVIDLSIEQHVKMCMENREGIDDALVLADLLKD